MKAITTFIFILILSLNIYNYNIKKIQINWSFSLYYFFFLFKQRIFILIAHLLFYHYITIKNLTNLLYANYHHRKYKKKY